MDDLKVLHDYAVSHDGDTAVRVLLPLLHEHLGIVVAAQCPLACAGLSNHAYNRLKRAENVVPFPVTIQDVITLLGRNALVQVPGVGRRLVGEIQTRFVYLGFSYRTTRTAMEGSHQYGH